MVQVISFFKSNRFFAFAFFLYVLQAETTASGLMAFVGTDAEQLWFPLCLFGSLALGNGFGVFQKFKFDAIENSFHILGLTLFVCFVGVRFFPELRFFWIALPLVAIGLVTSMIYTRFELLDLVLGFGVAGLVFYGIRTLFPQWMNQYQLIALFLCLFLIFVTKMHQLIEGVLFIVIASGITVFHQSGFFEFPSRLQQVVPSFKDAARLASPKFTDLFRSDLMYLPNQGLVLIMVNGQRYAVLPTQARIEEAIKKNDTFITSYDSPYVMVQPKKILVIGPAEGGNIIAALKNNVPEIWSVDINPSMYQLSLNEARSITGGFYDLPQIHKFVAEGRSFIEETSEKFDLITLQGVQTGSIPSRESTAVIESFLFTEEALQSLWKRLNDGGVLYFDEYQKPYSKLNDKLPSLLNSLATSAKKNLDLENADQQVRLISYLQAFRNPNSSKFFRARREALFISRTPISDVKMATLQQKIGSGFSAEEIALNHVRGAIVDDRPSFVMSTMGEKVIPLALLALLMFFLPISCSRYQKDGAAGLPLVLLGMIHMLFVMAIAGPATLILGHPSHVVPVIYGGLLGGSVFGAWIALKLKNIVSSRLDFSVLMFFIFTILGLVAVVNPSWFANSSVQWQFALFFLISVVFGMAVEVPYIRLLSEVQGQQRAFRFFIENLGALSGVPLGLLIQIYYGSTGTLIGAFLLSGVLFAYDIFNRIEREA
jgi:hypothetical protein